MTLATTVWQGLQAFAGNSPPSHVANDVSTEEDGGVGLVDLYPNSNLYHSSLASAASSVNGNGAPPTGPDVHRTLTGSGSSLQVQGVSDVASGEENELTIIQQDVESKSLASIRIGPSANGNGRGNGTVTPSTPTRSTTTRKNSGTVTPSTPPRTTTAHENAKNRSPNPRGTGARRLRRNPLSPEQKARAALVKERTDLESAQQKNVKICEHVLRDISGAKSTVTLPPSCVGTVIAFPDRPNIDLVKNSELVAEEDEDLVPHVRCVLEEEGRDQAGNGNRDFQDPSVWDEDWYHEDDLDNAYQKKEGVARAFGFQYLDQIANEFADLLTDNFSFETEGTVDPEVSWWDELVDGDWKRSGRYGKDYEKIKKKWDMSKEMQEFFNVLKSMEDTYDGLLVELVEEDEVRSYTSCAFAIK